MKRIIVPTDFSQGAWNAFQYAMDLAQAFQVEHLLVLNSYYEPHTGAATMRSLSQLMRETSEENLENLQRKIKDADYGENIDIQYKLIHAPLVRALQSEIINQRDQLIIMGTLGETGALEKLVGSNTSAVMAKVDCPVLVVPHDAHFSLSGKLVLAADTDTLPEKLDVALLESFVKNHSKALLEVVQVINNGHSQDPDTFKSLLAGIPYEYHKISGENVAETLDEYITQEPTDMLMLIRLKRGLLENLFHKSITKKLTLHASVPLLILKEVE